MNQFHDSGSVQARGGRSPFKCFVAAFVALATLLVFAVVSIASMQPSAVGAAESANFDLKNWVTSVTMEKKSKSDWQWVPATGDNIAEGDSLRFSLEYTVPGNTLSEGNRTLTYEAPFNTAKGESGKVLNNAGEELGTYTIDEQGKISITFNETTAVKNQNGNPIDGYIRFQADVDKINNGQGGKFDFGDNHEVTINVKKASDLTITKTAAQQGDDGTIKYDITVTSAHGTSAPVTIIDAMKDNAIAANPQFTVKDKNWADITSQCSVTSGSTNAGSSGFTLSCPQMSAGGIYHISYMGKANLPDGGGKLTATNDVTGSSKSHDGKDVTDKSHTEITWDKKPNIAKTGEIQADGRTKWTVTINSAHVNLKGWELKDVLLSNDVHIDGTVSISPAVNGWTGTLPFTFAVDTTESYTLTYYTTAPTTSQWVTNQAVLTPPSDSGSEGGSTGQSGVEYNPVEKTGGTATPSADLKTVTLPWTVTIKPKVQSEVLRAPWTYTDSMSNGQWLTQDQQAAVRQVVNAAFSAAGLNNPTVTFTGDSANPTGFTITSNQELGMGKSVSFSYNSTVSMPAGNTNFTNQANIGSFYHSANITVKPITSDWKINKTDRKTGQTGNSKHEYYQLDCAQKQTVDGKESCTVPVLQWEIRVDQQNEIAANDYADLTITETLPDGLKLVDGNQNYPGLKLTNLGGADLALTVPADGQTATSIYTRNNDTTQYPVKVTLSGNQVLITIPKELLAAYSSTNGNKVQPRIQINATFTDGTQSGDWSTAKVFDNTVKLTDSKNNNWGEARQSQTITKDKNYNAISKTVTQSNDDKANNILPYQLDVNPNGADLDPTKETITLTDVLKYKYDGYYNKLSLSLVPNSVEVYERNSDGDTGTET